MSFLVELFLFLLTGGLAGFLSGLLGIGGGVIVVPVLTWIFVFYNIPNAVIMHVAEGTSLAVMVITAIAATISHHQRQNINWKIWRTLLVPSIIGVIFGGWLASLLNTRALSIIFGCMLLLIAIQIFFFSKPKEHIPHVNWLIIGLAGLIAGIASGLLGIGGGALLIPFFIYCNLSMPQVSGTSAACVLPLSIVGTIVFMVMGSIDSISLPYSTGFIYWPAFAGVAVGSVVCVPFGTWVGARADKALLKRFFSLLLLLVALELFLR